MKRFLRYVESIATTIVCSGKNKSVNAANQFGLLHVNVLKIYPKKQIWSNNSRNE